MSIPVTIIIAVVRIITIYKFCVHHDNIVNKTVIPSFITAIMTIIDHHFSILYHHHSHSHVLEKKFYFRERLDLNVSRFQSKIDF